MADYSVVLSRFLLTLLVMSVTVWNFHLLQRAQDSPTCGPLPASRSPDVIAPQGQREANAIASQPIPRSPADVIGSKSQSLPSPRLPSNNSSRLLLLLNNTVKSLQPTAYVPSSPTQAIQAIGSIRRDDVTGVVSHQPFWLTMNTSLRCAEARRPTSEHVVFVKSVWQVRFNELFYDVLGYSHYDDPSTEYSADVS